MSTRNIIAASLLLGSACVAHADVLPASGNAQSGFLSGWTSGNGTDVVSSGVLSNGSTLIGGAAYGSGNLAESLYQKASASLAQTGEVKLSFAQGIEGSYLLGMSNAKLAALMGNGVSVTGSGDDITIRQGQTGADVGAGADSNANAGGGGGKGGSGNSGSSGSGGSNPGVDGGSGGGQGGNHGGGGGQTGSGGGQSGDSGAGGDNVPGDGNGSDIGLDTPISQPVLNAPDDAALPSAPAAAVPEPSTMALLMAGVFGAIGLGRRRAR